MRNIGLLPLCGMRRAVVLTIALSGSFAGPLAAEAATGPNLPVASARHMTLAEFAHTRARSRSLMSIRPQPRAWLNPDAAAALGSAPDAYLLYASATQPQTGRGFVNVYLAGSLGVRPRMVGQISGLDAPGGLAIDAHGTLYVAQVDVGAPVLIFPLGATEPSLKLDTQGLVAVAIAVSAQGNVFVSTATADILVYPRGATKASKHYSGLAPDGVQAVQTDVDGNIYFVGNSISNGTVIGEITPLGEMTLGRFLDHTNGLLLDGAGNGSTVRRLDTLEVYAHHTGRLLRSFRVSGAQSITLNGKDSAIYAATTGTIFQYAYASGKLLATFSALAGFDTFGLATFPASPLAPPW